MIGSVVVCITDLVTVSQDDDRLKFYCLPSRSRRVGLFTGARSSLPRNGNNGTSVRVGGLGDANGGAGDPDAIQRFASSSSFPSRTDPGHNALGLPSSSQMYAERRRSAALKLLQVDAPEGAHHISEVVHFKNPALFENALSETVPP